MYVFIKIVGNLITFSDFFLVLHINIYLIYIVRLQLIISIAEF